MAGSKANIEGNHGYPYHFGLELEPKTTPQNSSNPREITSPLINLDMPSIQPKGLRQMIQVVCADLDLPIETPSLDRELT